MRLDAFFHAIGPLLTGRATLAETVPRLYGEAAQGHHARDAQRLAIYARFCRAHRFEAVNSVYAQCRAVVVQHGGERAWEELVEGYFRAYPMRHFELNENGADLPAYLEGPAAVGLPPFLPELADFEWWEWQTQVAPDTAEDLAPARGPLRIGTTVELRRYSYDFVSWLDEEEADRPPTPPVGETLVLFWRDQDLVARRERVHPLELLLLRMVHEGTSVEQLLAQSSALRRAELEETLADLRQAGILLGVPAVTRHDP